MWNTHQIIPAPGRGGNDRIVQGVDPVHFGLDHVAALKPPGRVKASGDAGPGASGLTDTDPQGRDPSHSVW